MQSLRALKVNLARMLQVATCLWRPCRVSYLQTAVCLFLARSMNEIACFRQLTRTLSLGREELCCLANSDAAQSLNSLSPPVRLEVIRLFMRLILHAFSHSCSWACGSALYSVPFWPCFDMILTLDLILQP